MVEACYTVMYALVDVTNSKSLSNLMYTRWIIWYILLFYYMSYYLINVIVLANVLNVNKK